MAMCEYKCAISTLQQYFGLESGKICEELRWGPRTKGELVKNLKLPNVKVIRALSVLINFNFVEFRAVDSSRCEYSSVTENILRVRKYPRLLLTIRTKYGKEAECIMKQLLLTSRMSLYDLIIKVTRNLSRQAYSQTLYDLSAIKTSACKLIEKDFITPIGRVTDEDVPVTINLTEAEKIPKIDMQKLSKLYDGTDLNFPQKELLWTVNFDRFLVERRNEIIVDVITRRIDANAGVVLEHLLKLSYSRLCPLWRPTSSPISIMMIRESIGNDVNSDAEVVKYVDQYIRVIEEDTCGIIARSSQHSGAVVVCFKDFFNRLAISCISDIVEQKFGSKAARVFRLVQSENFFEVEEIARVAMLTDKEAKKVTYKLFEEKFLQMRELRKPGASSKFGPNKAFFLFHVDMNVIIGKIIGMCHQASYNLSLKRDDEHDKHKHLIHKKIQSDSLKAMMTEQGSSEEEIAQATSTFLSPPEKVLLETFQKTDRKLFFGDIQIDETVFLLQCYILYNQAVVSETKLLKKKK